MEEDKKPISDRIRELRDDDDKEGIRELRFEILKALEIYVGGDKISAEESAPFLGKSYRTVYSWLSRNKMYLPRIEDLLPIVKFIALVEGLTKKWKQILAEFHGEHNGSVGLYDKDMLRVLEGDQPFERKLILLVKFSLRKLAKEKEVEASEPGKD